MPDWVRELVGDMTAIQLVLLLVAVVSFVVLSVKVWPWIRRAVKVIESVEKLPEYMEATTKSISEIHHEVHYNNGSSVKDSVRRIEQGVEGLYTHVDATEKALQEHMSDSAAWKALLYVIDERTQPRGENNDVD